MNHSPFRLRRWMLAAFCFPLAMAVVLAATTPAFAANDDDDYGNSLDWVSADASIYISSLHMKEQIERIANSNAWQAFREIPSVAMGWQMAQMQINNPEGPAAMFWQLMELPENKQLVKMLGEMFSDEIVFYAGGDFPKFLELVSIVQGNQLTPMLQALNAGGGGMENLNEARMVAAAEAIEADPKLLTVPELVFAFKVKDTKAAETQLERMEVLANMAIKQSKAEIKLEREEVGDAEYLVLNLDGSMIPWPAEKPENLPIDAEIYESLQEIITDKEAAIALGVWGDYLVLSIGESTDHLEELGEGDLLVEIDEFDPLLPYLEEEKGTLLGVQYVSEAVMKSQAISPEDLDEMAAAIDDALENSDKVDDELKGELSEDLVELADDLKPLLGKPGAVAGCSLKTDRGFESFTYNWATQPRLDGSLPLELTNHLGGSPIIAIVARSVSDPEDYALLAKWVGKGIEYFEGYGLAEMDEEERAKAEKVLEVVKPLLARIDEATREHLIPALKDGQTAFVIDAGIESKQWQAEMPESFTELPLAELAIVMGVSDVDELKKAATEYWSIAEDAVDAIRDLDAEAIPEDFELPEPEETENSDGSIFTWKLPAEAKLDDQIAFSAAVGKHVAVIATSPSLAERALAETPLEGDAEVGNSEEPRAVVAGINFAALVDAVGPWVDYAIRINVGGEESVGKDPSEDDEQVQEVCSQVKTGLEILKCFRGAWSETIKEDGVWMTHSVSVFEDLEEQDAEEGDDDEDDDNEVEEQGEEESDK